MKNIIDLVTPFDFENKIDYKELSNIIDDFIVNKVDGIVVLGECSECDSLSIDEKKKLVDFVVKYVEKKMRIYLSLKGNIEEIVFMDSLFENKDFEAYIINVDKWNERGIISFYNYISDKLNTKIIVSSNLDLSLEIISYLSYKKNIVGFVVSSNDFNYLVKVSNLKRDNFSIYLNNDCLILAGIYLNVEGIINVIGNAYPDIITKIGLDFDYQNQMKEFLQYERLIRVILAESIPSGLKYLMKIKDGRSEKTRLPLGSCKQEFKRKIEEHYLIL